MGFVKGPVFVEQVMMSWGSETFDAQYNDPAIVRSILDDLILHMCGCPHIPVGSPTLDPWDIPI